MTITAIVSSKMGFNVFSLIGVFFFSTFLPSCSSQILTYGSTAHSVELPVSIRCGIEARNAPLPHRYGTGAHVPYAITQCYLPPGRRNIPAFIAAVAGTRFSDPGGMQG